MRLCLKYEGMRRLQKWPNWPGFPLLVWRMHRTDMLTSRDVIWKRYSCNYFNPNMAGWNELDRVRPNGKTCHQGEMWCVECTTTNAGGSGWDQKMRLVDIYLQYEIKVLHNQPNYIIFMSLSLVNHPLILSSHLINVNQYLFKYFFCK